MYKDLRFKKENGVWYIDLPNWIGPKYALSMVAGADKLLELYNTYSVKKNDIVELNIITGKYTSETSIYGKSPKGAGDLVLRKIESSIFGGATYKTGIKEVPTIHLGPVTLFVLYEYPEEIYVEFSREFMIPSLYYFTYNNRPDTGPKRDEYIGRHYDFDDFEEDMGKYAEALEISNNYDKGMSISEIAENMALSEEEIKKIMIEYSELFTESNIKE